MNRRWSSAIAIFALVAVASGCGGASKAVYLQQAVSADWVGYKAQYGLPAGGMAVYVTTPGGNYFASADMATGNGPNTHFRIASNTKTFTAAAIMLLNQQGKLRIDDTIVSTIPGQSNPYVPNTALYNVPYKSQITIRQLLSHTAGIFDVTNNVIQSCAASVPYVGEYYAQYVEENLGDLNHQFSPGELVGVDANCQIDSFVPGAQYAYTNTGYSLLGIIIEQVSGMPYDQFLMQNLITPNGLSATSVPMLGTDQSLPVPYSSAYIWDGNLVSDETQSNISLNIAEGNIISTPADLAQWVRKLVRGEAGPNSSSVAAMMTPTALSGNAYGLGLSVSTLGYGHSGAHAGYLSLMLYDPRSDVAAIIYCNVWDQNNLTTAQLQLLTQVLKDAKAALGY